MQDIAIKVEHVSKLYKLYDKPSDRLKEALAITKKKRYKEHYALNDVDFAIRKGETVGIIGTNGSGKSTILKIITGVLSPTGGNVSVEGRISALLELGAGFNMEYTGIENIYLNGTMMGYSKEEVDKKMQAILDFADIGDFVNQPCKTYSSGMFVRLAFAVAINIEPEILIVDEALSVGDVFFQAKCYHKFSEFKKNGKTILFVSHDLGSIAKYCDRVVLLNKGNKVAEGEPKEIIDIYKQILTGQEDWETDAGDNSGAQIEIQSATNREWKRQLTLNPELLEYGDRRAEIIDFAVVDHKDKITNNIQKNTSFKIRMRVRFHEDIEEPIFAFTIKDLQGTEVTGTNTMYEKTSFGMVRKNEEKILEFEQDMVLQGKNYLLSFGCVGYEKGELVVYHRMYDVCNIMVVSDKDTIGFFDMNSKVSVIQ